MEVTSPMLPDLELLLKLQSIDYDLGELERSKAYLPDMMANLRKEITDITGRLTNAKQMLEEAKLRQKSLELDIKSKEQELTKYKSQMTAIKTNKEYDALIASIDAVNAFVSTNETTLLQTIDQITSLEREIETMSETEKTVREKNEKELSNLQQRVDSIGEKVSGKQVQRNEVVVTIPKPSFATYERVRKGKGPGAKVVNPVRKRACGTCFKALTPRRVQEIMRNDRIFTCDSCGSLLYWDEESN